MSRALLTLLFIFSSISSYAQFPTFSCSMGNTYTTINGLPGPYGDDVTINVPLPFTFSYIGNTFTSVSICTNGWIALGFTTSANYTNLLCSSTPGERNKLCPFWDDLNTNNGGNIKYTTLNSAPNRIFVVQYDSVGFFSGSGRVTFQIKLFETSSQIEFTYGPGIANPSATGSVGIKDSVGGTGHCLTIIPGSTCDSTIAAFNIESNGIPYIFPNLGSGVKYTFNNVVGIINTNESPKEYKLYINYPNPFNPTTTVNFDIPKQTDLKLSVYNSIGQLIDILINGNHTAGTYSFQWDGTDYSSGLYFYKLETADFTDVKKMLLVK